MPIRSLARAACPPTGGGRRECWSWAGSSLFHVVLIAGLSGILLPTSPLRHAPPAVQTTWQHAAAELPVESLPLVSLPAISTGSGTGGEPGGSPPPPTRASASLPNALGGTAPGLGEPRLNFDNRVYNPGPLVAALNPTELVGTGRGGTGRGTGTGVGDGSGSGTGSGEPGEFFPLKKAKGRYVFVIDASRSMNHPYAGPARTRLGRAKIELWRTILRMTADQRYFVIFFNTYAAPMPSAVMRPGGPEGNEDLFRWTANIAADGNTDPHAALMLALSLQPDVIYVLTDGQFLMGVVRDVTRANTYGVQIDTISLGDDIGSKVLVELAKKNGGEYRRFDPANDPYWETESASAEKATER